MCRHLVDQYLEATCSVEWGKDARLPEFHGPLRAHLSLSFIHFMCPSLCFTDDTIVSYLVHIAEEAARGDLVPAQIQLKMMSIAPFGMVML
jgi:hypothetical protein